MSMQILIAAWDGSVRVVSRRKMETLGEGWLLSFKSLFNLSAFKLTFTGGTGTLYNGEKWR